MLCFLFMLNFYLRHDSKPRSNPSPASQRHRRDPVSGILSETFSTTCVITRYGTSSGVFVFLQGCGMWIRIRMDPQYFWKLDPDQHVTDKLDLDPH